MSESAPLLPRSNRPHHEHPIFFRVCHSPWLFVGQNTLLVTRGLIAICLTAAFAVAIVTDIRQAQHAELFVFQASVVSFILQIVYYYITAIWTLEHLLWPRSKGVSPEDRILRRTMKLFSIPRARHSDARARLAFSLFYTCTTTFPFVVDFLYWLALKDSERYTMEGGPLRAITHLSLNGINAFVALLEIMILSSVQMQKPFASHFASLLIVVGCYFVWTAIGHELTTHYVYKQLDPTSYGTRGVVMSVLTTMSVTTLFWFFTLGLHKIRVYASAQADCNTQNQ